MHTPGSSNLPLERQQKKLETYDFRLRVGERGRVGAVGDGVAWIDGLPSAKLDQLVEFERGGRGIIFHLREHAIGAIVLDDELGIASGDEVSLLDGRAATPVGDALLGRVIDPLGRPLDGGDIPAATAWQEVDVGSPPLVTREFVRQPLATGVKVIDTLLPIGKGQRQLMIGDAGTGKTSVALATVINQASSGVRCVYVLIGQRRSKLVGVLEALDKTGAMAYTTVVVAEADRRPGLTFLAPFTGCTIAEAWTATGRDTLVVYDDLSKHADAYRALSLILRRPPGREAYPGDIFFLHSRLLERATCLNETSGGGTLTALPIIETRQGEIADFIPTNLISITDGQIYFDARLFASGILPAIDVTKSVSRIGGRAQHPLLRTEAGRMRLEYLQALELEAFTHFGTRLEASTEARIARGARLRELLKQERLTCASVELDMAWLVAFNDGLLDSVPIDRLAEVLGHLSKQQDATLTLERTRSQWSAMVKSSLREFHAEGP